jgi:hypothetical protein
MLKLKYTPVELKVKKKFAIPAGKNGAWQKGKNLG